MEDFDNLIGDIYSELVNFKNEASTNPGNFPSFPLNLTPQSLNPIEIKPDSELDLYLIDNLFPVLFPALEELSREVERYQNPSKPLGNYV